MVKIARKGNGIGRYATVFDMAGCFPRLLYLYRMIYQVIGLMSGSSLDGLDIAFVKLEEVRGKWSFRIEAAECLPYSAEWIHNLSHANMMQVPDFLRLHTAYGQYLGEQVADFIDRHHLDHRVHFIASHGHTVFHDPAQKTTFQLGDGAALAARTGIPLINDLRAMDVALGGQGAPIVPIGDRLLFSGYQYLLNIGGIANLTIQQNGESLAFDVCPANQVLNALAQTMGLTMDEGGAIGATGTLLYDVLEKLSEADYYSQHPPKSLSNEQAMQIGYPSLMESEHDTKDLLHTFCVHIAEQISSSISSFQVVDGASLLITGGGGFNTFLVSLIREKLAPLGIEVVVPDPVVVKFKEALVMALIGTLRWRGETNVLASVTGASRDSVGGCLWTV